MFVHRLREREVEEWVLCLLNGEVTFERKF